MPEIKTPLNPLNLEFLAKNALFLLSMAIPILMLYQLDPRSFRFTWGGRALFVLFLWLVVVELVLAIKKLPRDFNRRTAIMTSVAVLVPILYVVTVYVFGLRDGILELGKFVGVPYEEFDISFLVEHWPLAVEFLCFLLFFVLSVSLIYGLRNLNHFATATFFVAATGVFFLLDTFYPFGTLSMLQAFVPLSTVGTLSFLTLMGYNVSASINLERGTILKIVGSEGDFAVGIFWPSAGVHSMLIYSLLILLFLRGTGIPTKRKAGYFALGAIGTYVANVLRIASVLLIGYGGGRVSAEIFHQYYGEVYFVAWVFAFLCLLFLLERYLAWRAKSALG